MSNFGDSTIVGPATAFGEILVAENTPITQITAVYENTNHTEVFNSGAGSSAAIASPFFTCESGTALSGFGSITTRRQVSYKAGEGLSARFTTLFSAAVAGNTQQAGLFSNTDRVTVGYNDAQVFGIFRYSHGASEIQELLISTPASSGADTTVTVNAVAYTVPITNATAKVNAQEIAASLNSQVPLYSFYSNDATVIARSLLAEAAGSFAYAAGTTGSAAAWSSISTGVVPTQSFIPQTSWNLDTRVGDLDPAKGNVWEISLQYLGFGALDIRVEDSVSGKFVTVHRIQYANTEVLTSVSNPTFRVGWASLNTTGTTSVTLKGSSAAAFVQGKLHEFDSPHSLHQEATIGLSEINLLSVRNRGVFGPKRNRVEIFPQTLSASSEATKSCVLRIYKNGAISGATDWIYLDKVESVTEYMSDAGTHSGGTLLSVLEIPISGGLNLDVTKVLHLLLPDETLTITAQLSSGASAPVSIGVSWQEDVP